MDTPSSIMYTDLKSFGHIPNRDVALAVLSDKVSYGGMSMRSRAAGNRTFLSRDVVHALPGQIAASQFADLAEASAMLAHTMSQKLSGGANADATAVTPYEQIAQHYGGPAAEAMRSALTAFSIDGTLYINAVEKIANNRYDSAQTRGNLLLMLFVTTGCLADPVAATRIVGNYAGRSLGRGLYTTETSVGKGFAAAEEAAARPDVRLGLLQLSNGAVQGTVLPLSLGPEGTVIGALASGLGDINSVGYDVSRRHLRIWRADDGAWYAQGLNSTNGTTLVTGDTREVVTIEPARSQREPGKEYPPVRISNSDTLCLGVSTKFLVMRVL